MRNVVLLVALAVLLIPNLALAADPPRPGAPGALSLSLEPIASLDFEDGISLPMSNYVHVVMKWGEAANLTPPECGTTTGYYSPETDFGNGDDHFGARPFSFWDARTTTYNWSIDLTDLQRNGITVGTTWQFRVHAVNCGIPGTGPYTTNSIFVPEPLKGPTLGTATRGSGKATLSWTPPENRVDSEDGNEVPIDKYVVLRTDDTVVGTSTGPSFEDPSPSTNVVVYVVRAVDKYGMGSAHWITLGSAPKDTPDASVPHDAGNEDRLDAGHDSDDSNKSGTGSSSGCSLAGGLVPLASISLLGLFALQRRRS